MTPAPLSSDIVRELARTRPTPVGAAALSAGLHTRRLLLLKSLLVRVERHGARLPAETRRCFEQDWALLEEAERADAGVVRDVVDYPMTGAWLSEALSAPVGPAFERHLAHLGGVALAAGIRAGCRVRGTRILPTGVLALPGLGVLRCPAGRIRLTTHAGLARITDDEGRDVLLLRPGRTGPGTGPGTACPVGGGLDWSALRTLPGGTVVLDDLDPYRVPSHGIGPTALAAAERPHSSHRAWARLWRNAHGLLSLTDPARVGEIGSLLRAVVPLVSPGHVVGTPAVSATRRAATGALLAQWPADEGELVELLVHEIHHSKLAALDELVPLCRPGDGTLYRVGWRPDRRPAPAVLQGAYAHLALTDLWWRARSGQGAPAAWRRRAAAQFETCREQVGKALSVLLESDELTFVGREFVREMSRYRARLGAVATPNQG